MEKEFYGQIEKYNLGKLAPADAEKFETAMRAKPELAAAVEENRTRWELRELMAEDLLRADIRQMFSELPPDSEISVPKTWFSKNWKFALLAVLVLGIAGIFVFPKSEKSPPELPQNLPQNEALPENAPPQNAPILPNLKQEPTIPKAQKPIAQKPKQPDFRQIALANYQTPDMLSNIRGQSDGDTLALAAKAFSEKNYGQTLSLLSKLPENSRREALLLRAHAQFGAGNFQSASRDFADLETGGVFRRDAEWFGFLSRLAVPGADKNELRNSLDRIRQQPKHPFQKDAERCWLELGF